jgi:hypothetical protein
VQRSTRDLETAIRQYIDFTNGHAKPFVWTKTADHILDSVAGSVIESLTRDTSTRQ